jgi:hypothetical protein
MKASWSLESWNIREGSNSVGFKLVWSWEGGREVEDRRLGEEFLSV